MQTEKLQTLQTHLRTLKIFEVNEDDLKMSLPNIYDKTRFAMFNYQFDCGMPACIAGHAKYIFKWELFCSWRAKFHDFFGLSHIETNWIIDTGSYKNLNPTPETAAKHIQDVLDGKNIIQIMEDEL